jgi:hypothetical protein
VSQALEDYDTARREAVTTVLEMLAAEERLASPDSDVLGVTGSDCEMDAAAARLAESVDALPMERKPAGWGEPPAVAGVVAVARTRFVKAALRVLSARYAEESADADADSEYAEEQLAIAARNLAADAGLARAARAGENGRLL